MFLDGFDLLDRIGFVYIVMGLIVSSLIWVCHKFYNDSHGDTVHTFLWFIFLRDT